MSINADAEYFISMEILKRTLVGSFGTGGRASHLCPPHAGRWTGVHCHPPRRCIATSSHCAPVRAVSSDNLERWDCRLYNVQRLSLFRRLLDAEENRRQKQKKAALEEVVHVEGVGGVRVHEDHRKTTGRPQEDHRKTTRRLPKDQQEDHRKAPRKSSQHLASSTRNACESGIANH